MIKSMTGFGRGEVVNGHANVTVEMRSVNHRYLETNIRLPRVLYCCEEKLRKLISSYVKRGKIDVFINFRDVRKNNSVVIDEKLAEDYWFALKGLAEKFDKKMEPDIYRIANWSDVIQLENGAVENEGLIAVSDALVIALQQHRTMRENEGENLKLDIVHCLDTLKKNLEKIKDRAPQISEEYRQRLHKRMVDTINNLDINILEQRICQEAALYADKVCINEEIVRLQSHLNLFNNLINNEKECAGKKLEFYVQEINREINTIGSKANDALTCELVIGMKSELEKIREQIQNIE